ncbi:MAG TPA: sugar transferase [Allosphingosinicella sp.]
MKRSFDILVSTIALVLLSPVLLTIAVGVRLAMGSPIVFRQTRPGLGGAPFALVKFRTMREHAHGLPAGDEHRLTRFGRFLRASSLDELPQLWNVLKGEMSLVGPRPLLMRYLPLYTREQARRHDVRPGLTGWAQVNGRNALGWEDKFELDLWYVDNRSMLLDLKIIMLTVWRVVRPSGIAAEGSATMTEFTGTATQSRGPDGSDAA